MDLRAVNPEIGDQGAELSLIAGLIPKLEERSAIDVGSERGAVAAVLRSAGADPMWLIEPFPGNVERLRDRFGADPGVHVLSVAAGTQDGTAELHLAHDSSGGSLDALHTLHPESSAHDLAWTGSVSVQVRSLDSLSGAGEIPGRLGVLKIDAEGSDADVLSGAGSIAADIVMVEFWRNLPGWVGPCPYELGEVRSLVEPLGPRRFLFVRHGRRHVSVGRWDSAEVADGEWGNLIFVSDELVDAVKEALPALDRGLLDRNEQITAGQERAAAERLQLIDQLSREADERLRLLKRPRLLKRISSRLRRARPAASAERPPLETLDDAEQERGGSGPV
jgi:FkbM family methyltransferase